MTLLLRILRLLAPIGSRATLTARAIVSGFLRGLSTITAKLATKKVKLFGVTYSAGELFYAIFWYLLEVNGGNDELKKKDPELESSGRKSFNKIFGKRQSKLRQLLKSIRGMLTVIRTWFRTNSSKPSGSRQPLLLPAIGRSPSTTLVSKGDTIVVTRKGEDITFAEKAAKWVGMTILLDYLIDLLLSVDDISDFADELVRLYSEYWDEDEFDVISSPSSDINALNLASQDGKGVQAKVTGLPRTSGEQVRPTFDLLRAMIHGDTLTPGEYVRYDENKAIDLIHHRNLGMHMDEIMSALNLNSQNAQQVVRSLSVLIIADIDAIYSDYAAMRRKAIDNDPDLVSDYFAQGNSLEDASDGEIDELLAAFVAGDPRMADYSRDEQLDLMALESKAISKSRVSTFVNGD